MMKVLWCDEAVGRMASTASTMRCSAESVPMVMSVPQKSLSIEPTIPTTFRVAHAARYKRMTDDGITGVVYSSRTNDDLQLEISNCFFVPDSPSAVAGR